jgi:adenylylsulfate kinase-like enzyme
MVSFHKIWTEEMIYWLCGQPGSGKTTLGKMLVQHYENKNESVMMIDGDRLRDVLRNYDYTESGRQSNLQSVLDIARYLDDKGIHVVIAVVAPYNVFRQRLKETNKVCEVYLHTSEVRGRESLFVKNFEVPQKSCIHIDTGINDEQTCLDIILNWESYDLF